MFEEVLDAVIVDWPNWRRDITHHNLYEQQVKMKDWESRIPEPDPFNRHFSAPDQKTRMRARAKRKKRK